MTKQPFLRLGLMLLCMLTLHFAYTQDIKIGVRAGIILANMEFDPEDEDSPDFKNLLGLQAAIPVEISFGEMFAVQPEIMYGFHGTRFDEMTTESELGFTTTLDSKGSIRIQTLEIPLLAKAKFGPEAFKFHVLAGPSFGFGLGGESKIEYSVRTTAPDGSVVFEESGDENFDAVFVKDGYNRDEVDETTEFAVTKTNFNLHFGAGFNVNVGNMTIFLDGRYMLGLTDLAPEEDGTPDEDKMTAESRRIGISAGILFPLN